MAHHGMITTGPSLQAALALADRAAVLVEGRERIVGSSAELLGDARVAALYLGRHAGSATPGRGG
jgi:branched-chain amino acid transport system ATP-binding protein